MDVATTSVEPLGSPANVTQRPNSFRRGKGSGGRGAGGGSRHAGPKKPPEIVKTWAFDSVGNRKYALQIRKAGNGNPFLKVVEGVPQPDGTFRRFDLTFWSEDWPRLFEMVDTVRAFIAGNNIRTPDGHRFEPGKRRAKGKG